MVRNVTTGERVVLASNFTYVATRRARTGVSGKGAMVRVVWVDHMVAPLGRPAGDSMSGGDRIGSRSFGAKEMCLVFLKVGRRNIRVSCVKMVDNVAH